MKLIKIEKEFFINEKLAKKYNTIVRFLEKNKNVVYEAGCINKLIINIILIRLFHFQNSFIFIFFASLIDVMYWGWIIPAFLIF